MNLVHRGPLNEIPWQHRIGSVDASLAISEEILWSHDAMAPVLLTRSSLALDRYEATWLAGALRNTLRTRGWQSGQLLTLQRERMRCIALDDDRGPVGSGYITLSDVTCWSLDGEPEITRVHEALDFTGVEATWLLSGLDTYLQQFRWKRGASCR